jgi:hypothetical protein
MNIEKCLVSNKYLFSLFGVRGQGGESICQLFSLRLRTLGWSDECGEEYQELKKKQERHRSSYAGITLTTKECYDKDFVKNISSGEFIQGDKTVFAVVRALEIIGEAAKNMD